MESFLQVFNKTAKNDKFSEESKKLITDMDNTESGSLWKHSEYDRLFCEVGDSVYAFVSMVEESRFPKSFSREQHLGKGV